MRGWLALAVACAPATAAAEARHHDGFYFRIAVGGGYTVGTLDADPASDSDSTGASVATQLAIGWTVRPGLVAGVGTFPMVVPAPAYDGVDAGGQHISATGPFLAYYFDPREGLHVQAGLLVTAGYLDGGERDAQIGFGVGATLGVGYDVYVSDDWSVGGILRATAYQLYGVDDSIRLISPAALVALTRH